jgi:hypothetical protein
MTVATCYIFYSVIIMHFDVQFYFCLFLIVTEIIILISNSWVCPLTDVARKYTDNRSDNFDIYLPLVIAKNNKQIFSIIFLTILIIYLYNVLAI